MLPSTRLFVERSRRQRRLVRRESLFAGSAGQPPGLPDRIFPACLFGSQADVDVFLSRSFLLSKESACFPATNLGQVPPDLQQHTVPRLPFLEIIPLQSYLVCHPGASIRELSGCLSGRGASSDDPIRTTRRRRERERICPTSQRTALQPRRHVWRLSQ